MIDEKLICKICNESFDNDTKLHRHFRKHGTNVVDYYQVNYPRKDKLTGQFIEFKSKEYYFSNDFNSKENLVKWFKTKATEEEAKKYITNFLLNRKAKKNLVFAPCQVELRSLLIPSTITIEKYLGNYITYINSLGFQYRFLSTPSHIPDDTSKILIDSREQLPWEFENIETCTTGLKYGDYKLNDRSKLTIERKNLSDFITSFSTDLDRLLNEFQRAKDDKAYMVVVVEENLNNVLDFKNKCRVSPRLKITPEYVFRNVRDILQANDSVQFLFADGRDEAARVAHKILTRSVFHIEDLQLSYDTNQL